jgi:tetratricopeptide (TPR) repeat protein
MRLDEASLAADPLHPVAYEMLGWTQLRLGQYAEAESSDRRVLELSPTFSYGHFELGTTLLLQGKLEESLAEMAKERLTHARIAGLAIASAALRRRSEADAHLARLEAEHAERAAYLIAEAHAVRGEKSQAFSWLDRAYAQRDSWLVSIKGDPLLRTLEGDARYKAFLRKMNLPE